MAIPLTKPAHIRERERAQAEQQQREEDARTAERKRVHDALLAAVRQTPGWDGAEIMHIRYSPELRPRGGKRS